MANKFKKFIATSIVAVAGVLAVAGCDDIEAKPLDKDYYAQILNADNLTNNQVKLIYDALISEGTSNSEKVLKNLLIRLSKSFYGSYYEEDGKPGLYDAVNNDKMTQFIENHPAYNKNTKDEDDPTNASNRVTAYYSYLTKKINETFIGIAKNSSYQERGEFDEEEWFNETKSNGYDLTKPTAFASKKVVNGNDNYEKASLYFADNYRVLYKDYIEQSVLTSLYQSQLTEQYLLKKNYGVLGRSYARQVEYVKLSDNSDYPLANNKLAKAYAKVIIKQGLSATFDFNWLSDLVKGTNDDALTPGDYGYQVYKEAGFDVDNPLSITVAGVEYKALPETTLGGYIKDYKKITDNRFTNDESIYNDYTSNGAYTKEVGWKIKYNSLVSAASTAADGWYTSSGLSGIPSTMKTRLFKVGVANEVDTDSTFNNVKKDYGWYVQGKYYLTDETSEKSNEFPYVVKADGATYIVRVLEAVKSPKLSSGSGAFKDAWKKEKIAYEVSHLLSDNDTYTKNAKQYFVENAELTFHDDYVYDYFADTFPDLFDEND